LEDANRVSYWVRGAIFGLLTWYGLWDLKVAAFASDNQIRRTTAGDGEVWKESGMAAPSTFPLKDLFFPISAFSALLIFIVIVGWLVDFL